MYNYIWIEFIDIVQMFFISQIKERYLQLMSAKDLYIQNITVSEHDNHRDSFQIKFPNVFTNYILRAVKVEDQTFIDWDHYNFLLYGKHN